LVLSVALYLLIKKYRSHFLDAGMQQSHILPVSFVLPIMSSSSIMIYFLYVFEDRLLGGLLTMARLTYSEDTTAFNLFLK